jgi:DNA invertase Pin-like site-specific DNA recombinase
VNAKAKGKILGRPRKLVDQEKVRALRENRVSLRAIAKKTGVSTTVVRGALREGEP